MLQSLLKVAVYKAGIALLPGLKRTTLIEKMKMGIS